MATATANNNNTEANETAKDRKPHRKLTVMDNALEFVLAYSINGKAREFAIKAIAADGEFLEYRTVESDGNIITSAISGGIKFKDSAEFSTDNTWVLYAIGNNGRKVKVANGTMSVGVKSNKGRKPAVDSNNNGPRTLSWITNNATELDLSKFAKTVAGITTKTLHIVATNKDTSDVGNNNGEAFWHFRSYITDRSPSNGTRGRKATEAIDW